MKVTKIYVYAYGIINRHPSASFPQYIHFFIIIIMYKINKTITCPNEWNELTQLT